MPLKDRKSLKDYFLKGRFPSEAHFHDFIDSTVNKIDDGFAKFERNGLQLAPQNTSNSLISFFNRIDDPSPQWKMALYNTQGLAGLSIDEQTSLAPEEYSSRLFIQRGGNIGIQTTAPRYALEVNGVLGVKQRVGVLADADEVPGDGKWHPILRDLTGINVLEVVASIRGPKKRGKYAVTHALALGMFDGPHGRLRQTRAYYGWFFNKIDLRWKTTTTADDRKKDRFRYQLEVRTFSSYGQDADTGSYYPIRVHVQSLSEQVDRLAPPPEEETK